MSNAADYDAPWDFTSRRTTHRFPAATYLRHDVAEAERSHAEQALHAVDTAASTRIGLVGGLTLGLVIAAALLAVGVDEIGGALLVKLALVATIATAAVVGLAALIHRHAAQSDALAERVRHYETRLSRLDAA